jgi:hypothetical protein
MDTLFYSFSLWNSLPSSIKLLTLNPQTLLLPYHTCNTIYKGYKWLYPPTQTPIIFTIENINSDEIDHSKENEFILISKY